MAQSRREQRLILVRAYLEGRMNRRRTLAMIATLEKTDG